MGVFKADCPHCGTRSVAFSIVHERRVDKSPKRLWDTLAFCGQCSHGILANFSIPGNGGPTVWLSGCRANELAPPVISPPTPSTVAPEYTPENVAEYYRQGMENLPGGWDAAGSMFRKVLDTGLKAKFPEIKGDLKKRIKKAAEKQELTPALAEWSDQIRLDGNDAAHDEHPFSKEEAKRLQTFTELVLIYLFKLPGMIEQAQGMSEEETEAS